MHFISVTLAKTLAIHRKSTNFKITGLGTNAVGNASKFISILLKAYSQETEELFAADAILVPRISSKIPPTEVDPNQWRHLQGIKLADPEYHIPKEVDILIGAELFYTLINPQKRQGQPHEPIGLSSKLGWLVGGGSTQVPGHNVAVHHTEGSTELELPEAERLDAILKTFWELEAIPEEKVLSVEDEFCEKHFSLNYTRTPDGRFVVKYPFKEPRIQLGETLAIAIRRFYGIERRLKASEAYYDEYKKFMKDYEDLGHMIQVDPPRDYGPKRCYIPHHFVLKESSTTTKFRVVFDASAKTANGISLNQTMLNGPQLQSSLMELIMRFRTHRIAITADIAKMYRQILVSPEVAHYQCIVWRESPELPLRHYKLLTVTYGTGPAPFLATRTLKEIAVNEEKTYPEASQTILEDFHMDDMMSGADTDEGAIQKCQEVITILGKGKMEIRKFTSNSEAVLSSLPANLKETPTLMNLDIDTTVKALGIYWNPATDTFGFRVNRPNSTGNERDTKRKMSSKIAKLFDPIGYLAPVIIEAKIMLQQLWKVGTDWDEEIPEDVQIKWNKFQAELPNVEKIQIPRFHLKDAEINCRSKSDKWTLLAGFADASDKAYGACIYLCVFDTRQEDTKSYISLVTSKTKVAPIEARSTPRLELCAAEMLSKLMKATKAALKIHIDQEMCFSDSNDVVAWIKSDPSRWQKFVANRVSKIQKRVHPNLWRHVKGIENPADLPSRGITASELVENKLWWNGPEWLKDLKQMQKFKEEIVQTTLEPRKTVLMTRNQEPLEDFWYAYSSVTKLQKVRAWVRRFLKNYLNKARRDELNYQFPVKSVLFKIIKKKKIEKRVVNGDLMQPLELDELQEAFTGLIRQHQYREFSGEIEALTSSSGIDKKSDILSLNPHLDSDGLLRVGGRLVHANMAYDQRHPYLLRGKHPLAFLLAKREHLINLHAGQKTILSALQRRFWITRCRDVIKSVLKGCVKCTRLKGETMQQIMANLPSFRVYQAFPFQHVGVDYAGPFETRTGAPKSRVILKSYIALFICTATKAIHIEIINDLSTLAFLAGIRRFISRRGRPSDIYSDCGTNFVGADNEMKEMMDIVQSQQHNNEVAKELANEGIKWHFNSPGAPHHGGLWEAGVKSTKHHLRRVMGNQRLTYEELSTLTTQIEAILNSRPVTAESSDPNDLRALTPGHFLIGRPVTAMPETDLTEIPENRLLRWQLMQRMTQDFWRRWSDEYVTIPQQRPKWKKPEKPIEVGAIVIIKDENLPPLKWRIGRVMELKLGADNHVRRVIIRTKSGMLERPIVKICQLPVPPYQENKNTDD